MRRMYILLLLVGMVCICLLSPFGVYYCSSLLFSYWSSVWIFYPLLKVGYQSKIHLFCPFYWSMFPCFFLCLETFYYCCWCVFSGFVCINSQLQDFMFLFLGVCSPLPPLVMSTVLQFLWTCCKPLSFLLFSAVPRLLMGESKTSLLGSLPQKLKHWRYAPTFSFSRETLLARSCLMTFLN